MEILAAYDLTGSLRDAAELAGCSHHTVGRYVAAREEGRVPGDAPARRADASEGGSAAIAAKVVERVLTDDATRRDLIARGRDRLGAFSWQETARALAACYRRLAERGR